MTTILASIWGLDTHKQLPVSTVGLWHEEWGCMRGLEDSQPSADGHGSAGALDDTPTEGLLPCSCNYWNPL